MSLAKSISSFGRASLSYFATRSNMFVSCKTGIALLTIGLPPPEFQKTFSVKIPIILVERIVQNIGYDRYSSVERGAEHNCCCIDASWRLRVQSALVVGRSVVLGSIPRGLT